MSKQFNAFEKATIKNSAKAVAHYQAKNEKLDEKIKQLEFEKQLNSTYIEQYSKPVIDMTGYKPLDLCEKVSRGSQMDWVFKYPDTIVPTQSVNLQEPVEQNPHLYEEEVTLRESVSEPVEQTVEDVTSDETIEEREEEKEEEKEEDVTVNNEDPFEENPIKSFSASDWI